MCKTRLFFVLLTTVLLCMLPCKGGERRRRSANISIARILGGKRANLKDYAHVAQFFNERSLCGANIITARALITAAHCMDNNKDPSLMVFAISNTNEKVLSKDTIKLPVWDHIVHQDYDDQSFRFDIAIIFTDSPMKLSITAQRGLIVDTDDFRKETRAAFVATGWGWTAFPNGTISNSGLQVVSLSYVNNPLCMKQTGMSFEDEIFCLNGENGKDTCVGDSGSGIIWRGMIVGLVSCGDGCGIPNSSGMYSNVFYLMEWMENEIDAFHERLCDTLAKRASKSL